MNYDLEERTNRFSINIINFLKQLEFGIINKNLIDQLVRSASSIGANYMEANHAISKKDFKNKIHICRKEANESKYWIRLIAESNVEFKETCRILWKEAQELTLIFAKISRSC